MRTLVLLVLVACGPSTPPPVSEPAGAGSAERPEPAPTPKAVAPSSLALACKSDDQCMLHRCNVQVGKCAYPCGSDADCTNGARCENNGAPGMAICVKRP